MRIWIKDVPQYLDKEIQLYGWVNARRDHGKIIFIDLKDKTGQVQIVFSPDTEEIYPLAETLRSQWVIGIKGIVKARPKGMENEKIALGTMEIEVRDLKIISPAKTSPFNTPSLQEKVGEETRLRYRYLDLRQERLQENLKKRHQINQFIRNYLTEQEFLEVETPILTRSTPEGARDYIVPARLNPGKFYALPQSPQQYKQLLMVAEIERYFQIARCFRDEDTRGDRQPEFTQLDLEMDFSSREDILTLIENLLHSMIEKIYPQKKISAFPFPRLSYQEAMKKYHSDRPDLRKDKKDPEELAFAFVVDFPLFQWKKEEKKWDTVHHPFTRPQFLPNEHIDDVIARIKKDPGKVLAHQYDLVLNGLEIGGGSLRIHEAKLLEAVFETLGHQPEEIQDKFGHLMEAFSYGVPPHGGIALGLDRILMVLAKESSIREVIAFPKTGDGRDLMMHAPAEVDPAQLKELHLKLDKDIKKYES